MTDILERFLQQCHQRPDHAAVVESGQIYRYGELQQWVMGWAAALAQFGIDHPRVLIHLPAGAQAYAAMLATAASGGYYAPTNTAAPLQRQQQVASQFDPDVIITTASLRSTLTVELPALKGWIDCNAPLPPPLADPRPSHDLVYILFTSGSTGIPKGVMIPRSGLNHYIAWALQAMAVTPDDRWSQHPNIAFDLSVLDIYGALCGGATLFPLTTPQDRLMPALAIRRHALTIWNSVPSVLDLMLQSRQLTSNHLASLRLATFCGEPLLPHHVEALFAARPDIRLHNTYGPTEATVSCTLLCLDRNNHQQATRSTLAIGEAIEGMGIHLMDHGELVITGPQLARGYWRNPQESTRAFRSLWLDGVEQPAYFTGDCCERIDGHIYFRHRLDHQVKIHGHRLELDEVSHAIRCLGFSAACCGVVEGELHAFIETADALDHDQLRQSLRQILPDYAIPKGFHARKSLPRNSNDKIDLKALIASLTASP
ncbi:MAG: AMP-binding protein [Magnetococcales bacterium]|nr:AMP-binding protein [Magnetococcales bacterium]